MSPDDTLLPSPAEVRCALHVDLLLQAHGLVELSGLPDLTLDTLVERLKSGHGPRLMRKLTDVIPPDDLRHATRGEVLDIRALIARNAVAHVIWVMECADDVARLARDAEPLLVPQRDDEEDA